MSNSAPQLFTASIIGTVSLWVIRVIEFTGYLGIFVLMTFESAGAPVPSEIIMPFSGFLVSAGRFKLWAVVLMGTLGNLAGSLLLYGIGFFGGRPFVERYGKYFLLSRRELAVVDRWFAKYGGPTVFLGRLLPVVRTYISLPAGLSRMPLGRFAFYTFLGSAPWSALFAWLGVRLGANWKVIEGFFQKFDIVIIVAIFAFLVWFLWRRRRHSGELTPH
ncbi:DedA family protein [Candidatus Parcubacteria bacterium]|nr:DedA family protein [Candidatus Parcubacteria bacterium]MBI4098958.1 DedA family protein [Candidatus Parcubacteria bacterium]MBI4385638.1 DedA family protein [Candidatus Parcubacteria bacterium]